MAWISEAAFSSSISPATFDSTPIIRWACSAAQSMYAQGAVLPAEGGAIFCSGAPPGASAALWASPALAAPLARGALLRRCVGALGGPGGVVHGLLGCGAGMLEKAP